MAHTFEAFPRITFPAWLSALGFEDHSWGNDAAARAVWTAPNGRVLLAWVEEDEPEERETCGSKWALCAKDQDDGDEGVDLLSTDDEVEFRATVEAIVGVAGVFS